MIHRRLDALLLIVIFASSASASLATSAVSTTAYRATYNLMPPVPQFSSEAAQLNFTIPYPVPRPSPIFGGITVLIIAVEFSDYNHTLATADVANHTIRQLNDYYSRVSYGAVSVTGNVVGWVRLPHRISQYGVDNGPFIDDQDGDGTPDSWKLLRDAVPLIADQVDLTAYQQVLVLHAGYGQESSNNPNDIWSVTYMHWTVSTPQRTFEHFAVIPEFEARGLDSTGVCLHEFGHLLGLPDLYSNTMEEVGAWDLMARGAWNGKPPGSSPAEMIAWDRIFLGWIAPNHILNVTKQTKVNATLDPIESPSSGLQAILVQTSSQDTKHYYLVEVRQKTGYDAALPSTGVLITYIDETKSSPVKVIDAAQTTSTLDDAPFQVGQKYSDAQSSIVISIVSTDAAAFSIVVDTLAPSPDVVVESVTLNPPTVHPNNTASLNVRIANEGTLRATAFLVDIYLNDTLFGSRKISLNAGETQQIQMFWTPKTAGACFFKVVLDPEKKLSESNRENNVKALMVVVGYTLTLGVRPPNAGGDLEWWLIVNGANETHVGIGEFQIGVLPGTNTLEIQQAIYLNPSSRYIFQQWSDGVTSNPRTITVSSDVTLSAAFAPQFYLSLEPSGGVTSPSGWYDIGANVTITATSPANIVEKQSRFVFLNWTGDIASNSTTMMITMNRPYNTTANWKLQYYLWVESSYAALGEGWYDANTQAAVSLSPTITTNNGTRYLFVQWSGDLSGVDPNQKIVMSGPKFVSAVWATQYELRVESEYGHTAGAGWYAPDIQATFIVDTPFVESANGTRRVFTKWYGDATGTNLQGMVVMDGPRVIRANWKTQYQVTFATKGVRNGTALTIAVGDKPFVVKTPQTITFWYDSGSPVSFSVNATAAENFRQYVFVRWENSTGGPVKSPQYVLKPETYIAVYKELSLFPCIIATVTFGSELTPEVQFLRNFRDHLVLSTRAGSAFMSVFNVWYYSFSPQVANLIASHDAARDPVRITLYPLIGTLELSSSTYSVFASAPEFAIIAAGALASALIGLIYLTPISLLIVRLLGKNKIGLVRILTTSSFSLLVALVMLALGEWVGSFIVLAVATSSFVLIVLVSTPLVFSFLLIEVWDSLRLSAIVTPELSRLTAP